MVYKNIWTHFQNEQLFAKPNDREADLEYDKYSVGIFIQNDSEENELVCHAPVKLSSLLYHFLNADSKNPIKVSVIGKQKREIGLVVPAKYECYDNDKQTAKILD